MSTPETMAAPAAPVTPPTPPPTPAGPVTVYEGLTLEAHRNGEAGRWEFGVRMGGAFIKLVERKAGGVDDDLREAAEPGFKKNRADAYLTELLTGRR